MERSEFEALRNVPGKVIRGDIRLANVTHDGVLEDPDRPGAAP